MHKGLYSYRRLPFGLNCALAIFQKIIDQTVAGIPGVVSYLNDLVVTRKTDQEHIANLNKALDRLKTAGFRLKMEKCEFSRQKSDIWAISLTRVESAHSQINSKQLLTCRFPRIKKRVAFLFRNGELL